MTGSSLVLPSFVRYYLEYSCTIWNSLVLPAVILLQLQHLCTACISLVLPVLLYYLEQSCATWNNLVLPVVLYYPQQSCTNWNNVLTVLSAVILYYLEQSCTAYSVYHLRVAILYYLEQSCTTVLPVVLYYLEQSCSTDGAQTVVKKKSKLHCASGCSGQLPCREFNFDETTEDCSLFKRRLLLYSICKMVPQKFLLFSPEEPQQTLLSLQLNIAVFTNTDNATAILYTKKIRQRIFKSFYCFFRKEPQMFLGNGKDWLEV